jgi:hypothetical protein
VPHGVFHVVSEDPEEPHVANEVEPPAVQECRGDHRVPSAVSRQLAGQVPSHGNAGTGRHPAQKLTGNRAQLAHRTGEGNFRPGSLKEYPGRDVQHDYHHRHKRRLQRGILVLVREHSRKVTTETQAGQLLTPP